MIEENCCLFCGSGDFKADKLSEDNGTSDWACTCSKCHKTFYISYKYDYTKFPPESVEN